VTWVAVTGGAGFIGSHLVTSLVEQGFQVRVLDNLSTGSRENLEHLKGRIDFVEGEIADEKLCRSTFDGVRYLWHLAALGSVPRSLRDPLLTNRANVDGTLTVLWAARQMGVERVVFASSSSVYGTSDNGKQKISDLPRPASPYAVTKVTGEQYMRAFFDCYGLETVSLRFFNVFGPRQDPDNPYAAVIPSFIRSLLAGQPAHVEGDGDQGRDFIYVDDCVQACLKGMMASPAPGKVYNVARGELTTINELYNMICDRLDVSIRPVHIEPRPGDVRNSRADISATIADLDFEPAIGVNDGLERAIPWYREYFSHRRGKLAP
jgi:nucleoside-diphosphate-sugar epimerase